MPVFQLYKKRDFSTYIGDTFQFFKQFGKDYFRNYLAINGALLLIMCFLYFLFMKQGFGNMYNPNFTNPWLGSGENIGLIIGFGIIFILATIVFAIFSTAFPMVYIKMVDTTNRDNFRSSELLEEVKKSAGRILMFGIISFFLLAPLFAIVLALCALLMIILIGIPAFFLALGTFMVWTMQSLYVYLNENTGYFEALGKGWKITFSNYWNIIGSSIVMAICASVLGSIFSMIPAFASISAALSGVNPAAMTVSPMMLAFNVLGMLTSYIMYNAIYLHQGIVYYTSLEATAHHQTFTDIENIGTGNEE